MSRQNPPGEETFEEFFAREAPALVRLANAILWDAQAAEEVVQDAFAKALLRWHRIENPAGYLRTSVVQGCRGEIRRNAVRQRIRPRSEQPWIAQPDATAADAPLDPDLLAAIARLSATQRMVVVCRFWGDMSEADIAEAIGRRPGTVKSSLSRALARLERDLAAGPTDSHESQLANATATANTSELPNTITGAAQ